MWINRGEAQVSATNPRKGLSWLAVQVALMTSEKTHPNPVDYKVKVSQAKAALAGPSAQCLPCAGMVTLCLSVRPSSASLSSTPGQSPRCPY